MFVLSALLILFAALNVVLGQSIISPANGTFYQSGDSVQTVIRGLKPGGKYRLAFYPTETGRILQSLNFTASSDRTQYYYMYVPLAFSGDGTIQLMYYRDHSVPAFVDLNITPRARHN